MNKLTSLYITFAFLTLVLLLAGCTDNEKNSMESAAADSMENSSDSESTEEVTTETDENPSTNELEEADSKDSDENSTEKAIQTNGSNNSSSEDSTSVDDETEDSHQTLSQYSSEQIEYARIWLQLGPNQKIDELYVRHIPAGEPVNIHDETSANYPKDVVTLEGSRSVDGSVTYSSNGNGTINVYNVPSHWASPAQTEENFMKKYTEDIIKNAELVYVDPGDDEKVIEFIKMLNVNE
ncbi:hypothetical protein [Cytobacillus gottheilii]|uniref:hypothetical protein n=1 Tax=Cytobacillus gottheilii TaxID=859144 RepID=UPI0009BAB066|nr:hypothetical protein [Cytobacillus gottheilii]